MKNLENFFNSKKGKVVAWLTVLLVVILALLAIWFVKIKPQLNQKSEENPVEVIQQGEEMTGENESDELNSEEISGEDDSTEERENEPEEESEEVSTPYSKISNESYEINKDTNKITFDDDIEINSFVLSHNPDGPTEGDTWHDTNGKKEIELESDEINKRYVYYKAATNLYQVGSKKFTTLADAYDEVKDAKTTTIKFIASNTSSSPDSSTVKILSDSTVKNKSITIDTNGCKIYRSQRIIVNSGATLTVSGSGSIIRNYAGSTPMCVIDSSGSTVINGATIIQKGDSSSPAHRWYGINTSGGTLNIKSGTVKTTEKDSAGEVLGRAVWCHNTNVTISGGTIDSSVSGGAAVRMESGSGTVTISGSPTIIGATGVYQNATGAVTVSGSPTITGNGGEGIKIMGNCTGEIKISAGTFKSTTKKAALYSYGSGKITISGGSFDGYDDCIAIEGKADLVITGGTFIGRDKYSAINYYGSGSVTIGTKGGTPSTSSPVIQGYTYGVSSGTGFYFYDGILKGKNGGHSGTVHEVESGYSIIGGTEGSYKTEVLKIKLTVPTANAATYNGSSQTASLNNFDSGKMNVSNNTRTDAGSQNVSVSLKNTTNYCWSDGTTGAKNVSWTINKKAITVTGDNKSKTYGAANPAFTATVGATGISGQTGKISGTPACSATASSGVGTYAITQGTVALADNGTFKAANYSISWKNGTLTIGKANMATPSVSIDVDGKVTWGAVTGATSYQISFNNSTWETATSGAKYIDKSTTGTKTAYVKAISTSANYNSPSAVGSKSVTVYSLTLSKGTGISSTSGGGNYVSGKTVSISAGVSRRLYLVYMDKK